MQISRVRLDRRPRLCVSEPRERSETASRRFFLSLVSRAQKAQTQRGKKGESLSWRAMPLSFNGASRWKKVGARELLFYSRAAISPPPTASSATRSVAITSAASLARYPALGKSFPRDASSAAGTSALSKTHLGTETKRGSTPAALPASATSCLQESTLGPPTDTTVKGEQRRDGSGSPAETSCGRKRPRTTLLARSASSRGWSLFRPPDTTGESLDLSSAAAMGAESRPQAATSKTVTATATAGEEVSRASSPFPFAFSSSSSLKAASAASLSLCSISALALTYSDRGLRVPFLVSWRTGGAKATKRRRHGKTSEDGEDEDEDGGGGGGGGGGTLSRKASKHATIPSTSTDLILATPSAPPEFRRPARAQITAEQHERATERGGFGEEEEEEGEGEEEAEEEEEEEGTTVSQRKTDTFGVLKSSATLRGSAEGLTTALTSNPALEASRTSRRPRKPVAPRTATAVEGAEVEVEVDGGEASRSEDSILFAFRNFFAAERIPMSSLSFAASGFEGSESAWKSVGRRQGTSSD